MSNLLVFGVEKNQQLVMGALALAFALREGCGAIASAKGVGENF